ncbi:broad substrate specificity ATP-binding cassette transporter ABCG2-like [Brachionichthys hirsutus]|uniref:broad substrate specificity ATP-binding cassette transporter ABCG2-like n=1 Tax=Brachionichthys hirsutus TaxID=412623 RepID=UPI003604A8FB
MSETRVTMDLDVNGALKPQSTDWGGDQQGATVSFHNVGFRVKQGGTCPGWTKAADKDILIDLNGIMRPGLNAIMGPTGSGKSSFLDVLAARKDPAGLSGRVLIDGAPQPPDFKCLSGYVVQDDVVMGSLTVRENLTFSAALRLPQSIPHREKENKVNQLIRELGLSHVADCRVGTQLFRGLSGGERKRTSIGMEMIIDPSVLFLDEPTTGLDASTASYVLLLLKRMASQGRTVILSIHQPRYAIYRLFDSLTLLLRGQQVFHGPMEAALDYFSGLGYTCEPHNNPPDFFLDIINGDAGSSAHKDLEDPASGARRGLDEAFLEEYRNSELFQRAQTELERIIRGKQTVAPPPSRTITYNTGFPTQFRWVFRRALRNLVINPQVYFAQSAITLILSLIIGAIFYDMQLDQSGVQNRSGLLFFIVVNQCFSSISSAELFITERKLFFHEYISGYYRLSVYFLPKVLTEVVLMRALPVVILSGVLYFMTGLRRDPRAYFTFAFTLTLVAYTAASMTLAISADQSVVAVANVFTTVTFIFMMLFGGLLVNLRSLAGWLSWLRYASIPRYGYSALLVNELSGLNFCTASNRSDADPGRTCDGEDVLVQLGVDGSYWGFWQNHVALSIMMVVFLSITYMKLRLLKKFT